MQIVLTPYKILKLGFDSSALVSSRKFSLAEKAVNIFVTRVSGIKVYKIERYEIY